MFNRRIGLAAAMALVASGNTAISSEGSFSQIQIGQSILAQLKYAYKNTPNGRPSGAARAKRIARKRKNIRARSAK